MIIQLNPIFDVVRQYNLFCKILAGVSLSAAELPKQFIKDSQSAISDYISTLQPSDLPDYAISDPNTLSSLNAIKASAKAKEGLTINAINSNQLGKSAQYAQSIDPAANIFSDPDSNYILFSLVPVDALVLTTAQRSYINSLIQNSRLTTVNDLKQYRLAIQNVAYNLSNHYGGTDSFYASLYNQPPPIANPQPMTIDSYYLLQQFYDLMQSIDNMTSTNDIDNLAIQAAQEQSNSFTGNTINVVTASGPPNMDYVAGLAARSGITFNSTQSKILAPVPFGLSIEQIAARYLGDPQRWLEIVTLNNLIEPYIDETGFILTLLSNAFGRQIVVNSQEDLYIGQVVTLYAMGQSPTARTILQIDQLSDVSFLITLDGEANLSGYTLANNAYLQAYLPGTINSQQKIFIPSDLPSPSDIGILPPPSTSGDPLTGLSQVDLLLTDDGDLATDQFGNFRYSSGLTNIIQALKLKLGTVQGSSLIHPEFGLGVQPGILNSDIQIQDLYDSINNMITQDDRFQGVKSLQMSLSGPTLGISLGVMMAGSTGVLPLSFNLTS